MRRILLCLMLAAGSFVGLAMRPDEIEELLCLMSQSTIEIVVDQQKDGTPPKL